MNFKKIYLFLISAMIVTVMSTACGIIGGGETYKIGLLSPQTGPIAVYAPGFEDSANVAIAELNENEDGSLPNGQIINIQYLQFEVLNE